MQAQREASGKQKDAPGAQDSGEDESPVREKPQRPPNRRKKSKEPLVEEDIVDGFSILGFRTYEDLEVSPLFPRGHQVSAQLSRKGRCVGPSLRDGSVQTNEGFLRSLRVDL